MYLRATGRYLGVAVVAVVVVGTSVLASSAANAATTYRGVSSTSVAAEKKTTAGPARVGGRTPVAALKVMNYYPANASWSKMWGSYNHSQVDADFAAIASLGANAVRVIIQPGSVGYPTILPVYAARLRDMINTARARSLSVQLTLFDWWHSYGDVSGSQAWLRTALSPYAGDNTIALVEVQNELDISAPGALGWAKTMLTSLPSILPGVPRTISISGSQDSNAMNRLDRVIPSTLLDVVDVHLYRSISNVTTALLGATSVARGRPIFIGEVGRSTTGSKAVCTEQAQARFYQEVIPLAAKFGAVSISPWIYSDFVSATLPGIYRGTQEASYGLRRLNGSWKPAASVVRTLFAASSPRAAAASRALSLSAIDLDGNFGCGTGNFGSATMSNAWSVWGSSLVGRSGVAAGAGENGGAAAFLSRTGIRSSLYPSLMQELPVNGSRLVRLSANVRLAGATGTTRLQIAWFKGSTYLGGPRSNAAILSNAALQSLTVSGIPPVGATSFQIHLQSAGNQGTAYFSGVRVVQP